MVPRNRRYSSRSTPSLSYVYLTLALLGLGATAYYNVLAFQALGWGYPLAFLRAPFESSPVFGSLAADFWIGAIASTVWMVAEGRALGLRVWIFVLLSLLTAWAFALPLFLFVREQMLQQGGQTARIAAARLTGRSTSY